MYSKRLISRQIFNCLSRFNGRLSRMDSTAPLSTFMLHSLNSCDPKPSLNPRRLNPSRGIHSAQLSQSGFDSGEDDSGVNEFLSRFVWLMRGRVSEAYPNSDKESINGMLQIIVQKVVSEMENGGGEMVLDPATSSPPQEFSENLWKAVCEVCNAVTSDMKKAAKKEKMKRFLQCDEVKRMSRFALEVGVRGEMLRELSYKWACEKMEEAEFVEGLESLKANSEALEGNDEVALEGNDEVAEEGATEKVQLTGVSLPKRRGKIRYKIYGLDLSDPKWAEAADRVREAGEVIWPEEAKPITGKCKTVNEKILSLNEDNDPSPLLAEWTELLEPNRADWIVLLDGLKEKSTALYLKVAEHLLSEKSFQANVRDYSNLIMAYANENLLEDAQRIITKMTENRITADLLTATSLVHMYSKAGNLDLAKQAFESLEAHGFVPDLKLYESLIMASIKTGKLKDGVKLLAKMERRDIKPNFEICMALLRECSRNGDSVGAAEIFKSMQSAELEASFETWKLMIRAFSGDKDPDQARKLLDDMQKLGHIPDDECIASVISAYKKNNFLDKALDLLLQLEKKGFESGVATYSVLVDWLGQLQLIEEAEELLVKISELGEAPSYKLQVSLCDMYSRAGIENKALKALGVLESKKEELGSDEFERIIQGLRAGKLMKQAQKMLEMMEARGFTASEEVKVSIGSYQAFNTKGFQRGSFSS